MIRRKKTDDPIDLSPLSEENDDIDISLDSLEEIPLEDEKKKKKPGRSFTFPWSKKKDKSKKSADDSLEEIEKLSENAQPESEKTNVLLDESGSEYIKEDDEKKFPKKKIAFIGVVVVAVLAVVITFVVRNINSGSEGKAYVESVAVLAGLESSTGSTNRYTGEVEPQDTWKITLDSDMSVAKCYVEVGDVVKKGDKLFSYNTEELKLNQEKKQLDIDSKTSENTQLTKDISTYQNDIKSASTSEKIELQTEILTSQTKIKQNEYAIKTDKEEIEKIKKNIKDATVTSKMDGVVKKINASLGESSSDDEDSSSYDDSSSADSNVYMMILSVGDYRVKGTISETNISSLTEGDRVIVRSRVDDTTWNGSISSIKTDSTAKDSDSDSDSSSSDDYFDGDSDSSAEGASSYYFYVELDSADGLLMGQHVLVELDNGQDDEKDGMWISSAYVIVDGDNYYVWLDKKGRLEKEKVEVGEYDEDLDQYQILSGIDKDDYIACDDTDLTEGMKTTKVEPSSDSADEESTGEDDMIDDLSGGEYDDETYDDETYDDETYDYETYDDETYDDETYDDETYDEDSSDVESYDDSSDGTVYDELSGEESYDDSSDDAMTDDSDYSGVDDSESSDGISVEPE